MSTSRKSKCCGRNFVDACHKSLFGPCDHRCYELPAPSAQVPQPSVELGEDTKFSKACATGDLNAVAEYLKSGVNIEKRDKSGCTPLMAAVNGNHLKCVHLLLNEKPCVNVDAYHERTRDTALSLAASKGHEEVIKVLLHAKAKLEHRNGADYTPLCLAASNGHVAAVDTLLQAGADVDSKIGSVIRVTPLMMAAMHGRDDIVRRLFVYKADLTVQVEGNKNTALLMACAKGQTNAVKIILEEAATNPSISLEHYIDHRNSSGFTALMEAARDGNVDICKLLLEHGADANAVTANPTRDIPLSFAIESKSINTVKLLIENGAVHNVVIRKNITPLWLACANGDAEIVKYLLECRTDVDHRDSRGLTPLMIAFKKGHVEVVRLLVSRVATLKSSSELRRCLALPEIQSCEELATNCEICYEIIMEEKSRQEWVAMAAQKDLLSHLETEQQQADKRKRERRSKKQNKSAAEVASTLDDDQVFRSDEDRASSASSTPLSTPSSLSASNSYRDNSFFYPSSFEIEHGEWINTHDLKKKKSTEAEITSAAVVHPTQPNPVMVQDVPERGSKMLELTSSQIGRLIGRSGQNINAIRDATNASIDVQKLSDRTDGLRTVTVKGGPKSVVNAARIIELMLKEADLDVDKIIERVTATTRRNSSVNAPKPKTIVVPAPNPPLFVPRPRECEYESWEVVDDHADAEEQQSQSYDDCEELVRLLAQMQKSRTSFSLDDELELVPSSLPSEDTVPTTRQMIESQMDSESAMLMGNIQSAPTPFAIHQPVYSPVRETLLNNNSTTFCDMMVSPSRNPFADAPVPLGASTPLHSPNLNPFGTIGTPAPTTRASAPRFSYLPGATNIIRSSLCDPNHAVQFNVSSAPQPPNSGPCPCIDCFSRFPAPAVIDRNAPAIPSQTVSSDPNPFGTTPYRVPRTPTYESFHDRAQERSIHGGSNPFESIYGAIGQRSAASPSPAANILNNLNWFHYAHRAPSAPSYFEELDNSFRTQRAAPGNHWN